MATYTFRDSATGGEVLVSMSMREAVSIGESITRGGRELVRLPDMPQKAIVSKGVGHVSNTLPPWTPGADSYDSTGRPIICGQADVDRIKRKNPGFDYGEDAIKR